MRTFLTLVLILLIGGNAYETYRLRAEVSALERRQSHRVGNLSSEGPSPPSSLTDYVPQGAALLDEARRHAQQAEASLHLKDYERARAEVTDGIRSFEKANAAARADGDRVLAELRAATNTLQTRAGQKPTATPSAKSSTSGHAD